VIDRVGHPFLSAVSALLLAWATACQPAPPPAAPQGTAGSAGPTQAARPAAAAPQPTGRGGQIVYAVVGTDVRILNPILQSDTVSGAITDRLFEPLVETDPKTGSIVPSLASSWDVSPDGLTYTFKLRDGVRFHDGQPLTAEDARFTLDVLKTDRVKTVRTSNVEKISSVEVVDPHTLRVTLSESYCPFLNDLTFLGILPKHLLGASTNLNEDPFNLRPIGSGPFKFVEWAKDDHVTLAANDDYWNGRPNIDRFIFRPLKDRAALIAQLKTGEVDVAPIEPNEISDIEAQPGLQIHKYYALGLTYLAYNTRTPGLDDVQVRRALNQALDRQLIIDQVLLGEGRPLNADISPESWAYDPKVTAYEFDPARARQLLDAAGWTMGPGGVRQKAGQPMKYTIWTNSGNKVREAIVTIAQQQFKDVGVDLDLQLTDFASLINRINRLEFDMFVSGFVFDSDPDNYGRWHSTRKPDPATGKEGFNRAGFSTPELDTLIEQARAVPGCDQARRKELYARIQQLVADGAPWSFLHQERTNVAASKKVTGIDPSPFRRLLWNVQRWSVQP
jgi:peptide/nickel transport system substrate-binding protein